MHKLTNKHSAQISVWDEGSRIRIQPRETVEVKRDFTGHAMVAAGLLMFELGQQSAASAADDQAITVTDITGEDGVFTVRASDGVEFKAAKNQVRDDGTLTDGGIKAYEAAKAAQSAASAAE